MSRLDLPNVNEINGSREDKVLGLLFVEKALNKAQIKEIIGMDYQSIFDIVDDMEKKGYIYGRAYYDETIYYLNSEGCREAQYRLNIDTYLDIYDYFIDLGYYSHNVIQFMKYCFHRYYLEGVWEGNTLEEQYLSWCENNQLDPRKTGRKLKR